MGFRDWISSKVDSFVDCVSSIYYSTTAILSVAIEEAKDKLFGRMFDDSRIEDHIDVDAVLAELRKNIQDDVRNTEDSCMNTMDSLFDNMLDESQSVFPDIVDTIKDEQEKARRELSETVMQYVKEHLSKNDPEFVKILQMNPCEQKKNLLDMTVNKVLDDAIHEFTEKLIKYAERIQHELSRRVEIRMNDREEQMNQKLQEYEELKEEALQGIIDVDNLVNKVTPVMEASQCLIYLLENED